MEQELISKKDLLELYEISYGALYRWKRKGLIPEDWFIKKSTVTGQETFFPKALICERVELIKQQPGRTLLRAAGFGGLPQSGAGPTHSGHPGEPEAYDRSMAEGIYEVPLSARRHRNFSGRQLQGRGCAAAGRCLWRSGRG